MADKQLNVLKKLRTPHRAATTKLCSKIEEILNVQTTLIDDLEDSLEQLNEKLSTLKELDNKIFDLLKEDEIEIEVSNCIEYEEKLIILRSKLNRKIRDMNKVVVNSNSNNFTKIEHLTPEIKTVKLPKIVINRYFGEPDKYLDFWNQFENAIHKNSSLSDIDKFTYLKSLLGGVAANAISGFALSEDNYAAAIKILQERFGRQDLLVQAHLNNLLNISSVKNSDDLKALRVLYDKCEIEIRSLESLGVTSDTYSSLLCPMVLKILPIDLTLRFSQKQDKSIKYDIHSLIDFIRQEIESRERVQTIYKNESRKTSNFKPEPKFYEKFKNYSKYVPTRDNHKPNVSTAVGLFTPNNSNPCIFCANLEHKSELCTVLNVNEKKELLKKQGRCFMCLERFHKISDCVNKKNCAVCFRPHNVSLCYKKENSLMKNSNSTSTVSNHIAERENKILLQTAMIDLVNKQSKKKSVRCVFDGGAQRTYIKKEVSQQLSLTKLGKEKLMIHTFNSSHPKQQVCDKVEVYILDKWGERIRIEALEIGEISNAVIESPDTHIFEQLKAEGIVLADFCDNSLGEENISLLIGADYYWKILTGNVKRINQQLVACDSKVGWLLMGQMKCKNKIKYDSSANLVTSLFVHSSSVEDLWKLDVIGINDPVETMSREDKEKAALNYFRETVTRNEEGRYQVRLPWVDEKSRLETNLNVAEKRCRFTTNKLIRKKNFSEYDAVFKEWLEEEIIEDVPIEEIDKPCHYLPHRGVYKENSTTKCRPVFDAGSRGIESPSLNDCLEKGPNLLEQIPPILMRFRKDKIGVISDIKKAFLQISIAKEDRDFLRFLWWKNADRQIFRVLKHNRVVFGLNCSPFLLSAVLNYHLENSSFDFPETVHILKSSFYVDNCVTSISSEGKLHQFIIEATHILKLACFDLRGWEFTAPEPENSCEKPVPVLGMLWDKNEDVLFCNISNIDLDPPEITRRVMLSCVHKIFDIIGILCPATLIPKLIVQKSWNLKIGWDKPLDEEHQSEFKSWLKDVPLLSDVKIPRCLDVFEGTEISLHTFCDGSKHAYSAVVYIRTVQNNEVNVHLVQAKSRVAPLRKITIPRIELLACCIGARLASSVLKALNLEDIPCFFWSDSSTALIWIEKKEPWGVFVENRVREIRKLTDMGKWNHIPSAFNAADLPSRGCSIKALLKSKWWLGPEWLIRDESEWPVAEMKFDEEEVFRERKKTTLQALNCCESTKWYSRYFSRYSQILRMVAWVFRFINNCRNPHCKQSGELSVSEINLAEKKICKVIQDEMLEKDPKMKGLCTFVDSEGLIRLKTKIVRREDEENFRCPIVLPSNHPLTEKIILDYHLQMSHAGVQFVLANIRQKFWILRGRKTVQRILSRCIRCRRFNSKGIETMPAPLPEDRIRETAVFEVIGVDAAGPLYMKKNKKAWILLFTCAVYRSVHLELIESLSTNGFLMALRRFIARRGRPKIIYSDNGTNFVGADNLLRSLDWNEIVCNSSTQRIEWKFNPPTAAWWGGWWERLIQMVKKLLRNVLGKSSLTYEELMTILCDVEAVINSRPLTYVSEDPTDLAPLTPSMFIQDISNVGVPDLDHLDDVNLAKRYRFLQNMREHYRKRFRDEYLALLIQRPTKRSIDSVNKNDLVLVGSDNKKRLDWPLGRVIEIYPGKDDEVRVVKVKTATGDITRPVKRIYPLELNCKNFMIDFLKSKKDSPTELKNFKTKCGRMTVKPFKYSN